MTVTLKKKMKKPLLDTPELKPFIKKFKREGWYPLLLVLAFIRTKHGLGEAWDVLFGVDKTYISSHDPFYSKHDLWVISEGMWCIITCILLITVVYSWIKLICKVNKEKKDTKQYDCEQGVGE